MTTKICVNGPDTHNLYKFLKSNSNPQVNDINWNFAHFLVDIKNDLITYFEAEVHPSDFQPQVDLILNS